MTEHPETTSPAVEGPHDLIAVTVLDEGEAIVFVPGDLIESGNWSRTSPSRSGDSTR